MDQVIVRNLVKYRNIFLTGGGGGGKTYLLKNTVFPFMHSNKVFFACTATTGAAANVVGGCTFHRFAGFGLVRPEDDADSLLSRVIRNPENVVRWVRVKYLIIDEVSMLDQRTIELADAVAKRIRYGDPKTKFSTWLIGPQHHEPFGGIRLILCGDFCQLPPVEGSFCFLSPIWKSLHLVNIDLDVPKRFTDKPYMEMMQRLRFGDVEEEDLVLLRTRLVKNLFDVSESNAIRLFGTNKQVDAENTTRLAKLQAQEHRYTATDAFASASAKEMFQKQLEEAIPMVVVLKDGAHVMLRRNIEEGLYNGLTGVVKQCRPTSVLVRFSNGRVHDVQQAEWSHNSIDETPIATRTQIPLMLAYSSSIHKCQGATVDDVIVDLANGIFSPAQAYVALSRVRSSGGLFLLGLLKKNLFNVNNSATEFYRKREGEWIIESQYLAQERLRQSSLLAPSMVENSNDGDDDDDYEEEEEDEDEEMVAAA
jgi:ATP-dependent DNA helicase PIF1